ncbi:hypothetical protein QE152_g887 [Popillia japonica]|uniref:Uncharacterized protein n=1 Tax=Popillia japonica TaxID=7064 RepID=A0AAW1NB62_POPJA
MELVLPRSATLTDQEFFGRDKALLGLLGVRVLTEEVVCRHASGLPLLGVRVLTEEVVCRHASGLPLPC